MKELILRKTIDRKFHIAVSSPFLMKNKNCISEEYAAAERKRMGKNPALRSICTSPRWYYPDRVIRDQNTLAACFISADNSTPSAFPIQFYDDIIIVDHV